MTDPARHWRPRLRALLRKELERQDLPPLPSDLTIRHHAARDRDGLPWIEIRHNPGPTERCSVHDHVADFDASPEAIARFLEAGVLHARRMHRRDARLAALLAAGHNPRIAPLHSLEADPITALAFLLVRRGVAGIDGDVWADEGRLQINSIQLTTDGHTLRLVSPGTMRLEIDGPWPESLAAAMAGRPLGEIIRLPSCGRDDVDAAAAAVRILRAQVTTTREVPALLIQLERSEVVEIESTPPGEDGRWKAMRPLPLA